MLSRRTRTVLAVLVVLATLAAPTLTRQSAAQMSFRITGVTWQDVNCDGIRQDSEALIPNLRLTLRWAGANGTIDATDNEIRQSGSLTGAYAFDLAGAGLPYFISFRSEDKPAGFSLAPLHQGSDPTRDNDMTTPLAGTSLWATQVFTMPLDGSMVTGQDIGLCKIVFDPAKSVYLPQIIR
jgi:hypothetical protein